MFISRSGIHGFLHMVTQEVCKINLKRRLHDNYCTSSSAGAQRSIDMFRKKFRRKVKSCMRKTVTRER